MIPTDEFFEGFEQAGMTRPASWTPSTGGDPRTAQVLFRAPTEDALAGEAQSTNYSIRYPATKLVGLKRFETITVSGVQYKVREEPRSELDGTRMVAFLEIA